MKPLPHPCRPPSGHPAFLARHGFTLFELMVVVAILGILATISMPALITSVRKGPMKEAVANLQDACRHARMKAVLEGRPAEVVIQAGTGAILVRTSQSEAPEFIGDVPDGMDLEGTAGSPRRNRQVSDLQTRLPESVAFRELVVNLQDSMDDTEARVRFYPDGTCDDLKAVLFSEQNEVRVLRLEITTGRDIVEEVQ